MLEGFSVNSEYVVETIPNLGFFQKKQWINDKLKEFSSKNALVVIENDKILWSLLDDEDKFWLPYEKGQFYLSLFEKINSPKIIIEQIDSNEFVYYGFVDDFLISYASSFEKSLDNMEQYCNTSKIKVFGVGSVSRKCHATISFDSIKQKLNLNKNYIDDDLIYIKEDDEDYDFKNKSDEIFMHWFQNKDKIKLTSRYGLMLEVVLLLFFTICSFYYYYQNNKVLSEINEISKKLN